MWLAVCSDPQCQWDHVTNSPTLATAHLQWHILESNHRGAVVEIPAPDPQRAAEVARRQKRAA
jgi:hypothetical protein